MFSDTPLFFQRKIFCCGFCCWCCLSALDVILQSDRNLCNFQIQSYQFYFCSCSPSGQRFTLRLGVLKVRSCLTSILACIFNSCIERNVCSAGDIARNCKVRFENSSLYSLTELNVLIIFSELKFSSIQLSINRSKMHNGFLFELCAAKLVTLVAVMSFRTTLYLHRTPS